jgi:hypothetical protein
LPEQSEPRSIIEAAEQAAAAGNYASAEELLREAALVQEASLGPLHPDLAHTLNNLGVVCEITGNPVDAEHYFRRAFTIATTVLEPDHPFVATSRKNLSDFCEARGKHVELPTSSPAVTAKLEARESPVHAESQDSPPHLRKRLIRPLAIAALGPGVMLIVILTTARPWLSSTQPTESSSAIAMDSPREIPALPRAHLSVEPIPLPKGSRKTVRSDPDGVSASRITAASTRARPMVVRARLCADLDEWLCDPPDRPVPPGPLFFYTQVKSAGATMVQHRWYRDNRLHRSVELFVRASPGGGYRTYSRETMNSESAGSWRVELRTEDGVLLHEERFSVR